ncbi:sugar ABC transporter substrate-binding protein [Nocardia colli]|uniref:Sugar ABC transporter substrate-binding protein n=1 Tax=Nocardia colli TaxID=2545717 RepID=A0A5N0DU76_9NOCA|nr:sugar ABC transporter substrate-binding protein [Nocardia colli]KAA8880642.1 sugar ABC transporter substrate-binding protein [Nocardia colli]
MQIGRRAFLRGAGAAAGASVLVSSAGCGHDEDALTFFFQANPEEARGRMRVIDEFARLHPDIKVRTVLSGPDPMQQMLIFCAGGKCPDVLMAWEQTYACLADRGVLLDLNTMLADDPAFAAELKKDSIPALYDTFAFKGGQYAFPEQWSGNFLFYNRQLLAEAGLMPPGNWSGAWSFAEFLDAARTLTMHDRSGKTTQWGFVETWVPHYSAGLFGMNNGVSWTSPRTDPARSNFGEDAFIEGVQFYSDLANKYRVAPTAADTQSMASMDLFGQGRAAFALGGHWRYNTFTGADNLELDVTALPVGPKGLRAQSNIGTTGLAIAAASPRKQQAWEFLKFMTGPVGQAIIAETGLFVPVRTSAVRSPGFATAHTRVRNLQILTDGPANSAPLPVTPAWERVDALMRRYFGPVLRGSKPATSLRNELARDTAEVLTNR